MALGLVALLALALPIGQARAQALVADLSDHFIAITTGFVGADVLLFGAIEGDGDVVVVLRGPSGKEVVRRAIPMEGACDELIDLIKGYGRWVEKEEEGEGVGADAASVAA